MDALLHDPGENGINELHIRSAKVNGEGHPAKPHVEPNKMLRSLIIGNLILGKVYPFDGLLYF